MALFAVNTGPRQGELVVLRWLWEVQVPELSTSVFVSPDVTKNGDERVLILNDIARRVLEEQRGQHSEFIFSYNGKPMQR